MEMDENLKLSFEMAKTHLQSERERLARLDNKFNFILVFLAALITGLNIIFPFEDIEWKRIVCLVLIIELVLLILCSGIIVLIGLYPKENQIIDENNYIDSDINSLENNELLKDYTDCISKSITSYTKTNEKKSKYMKTSFILAIISFCIFGILMIIKLI